jgi:hypothetical protein
MLHRREPAGWVHLVAHMGRELMNRLPDYYPDVPSSGGPVSYQNYITNIISALPDGFDASQPLPRQAAKPLKKMLDKHREKKASAAARTDAWLAYTVRSGKPAAPDDVEFLRRNWQELATGFVQLAHVGGPEDADRGADALAQAWHDLELLLLSRLLEVPYHELGQQVRALALKSSPKLSDLHEAWTLVRDELRPAFFATATPAWLPLLDADGWFAETPLPERGEDWVSFPNWAQAGYLARVAAERPDDVLAIVKRLADTENERVRAEFALALQRMPDAYADEAVELITAWLNQPQTHHLLLPSRAVELLGVLIERRRYGAALRLGRSLLAVGVDSTDHGEFEGIGRWVSTRVEPARLDTHRYRSMLRREMLKLGELSPLETVELLIDILSGAIDQELAARGTEGPDNSSLWRQAVETGGPTRASAEGHPRRPLVARSAIRSATAAARRFGDANSPEMAAGGASRVRRAA